LGKQHGFGFLWPEVAMACLRTAFLSVVLSLPIAVAFGRNESEPPLFAIAQTQDSPGFTEADLTPSLVRQLEESEIWAMREKFSLSTGSQAGKPKQAITADSMLLMVEGRKVAVIQLSVADRIREVTVMGFRDGEFHRVGCVRESSQEISLFSGKCGKMVSETFRFSTR
jgi:hypothetical protein